jgi:hypothetical protein
MTSTALELPIATPSAEIFAASIVELGDVDPFMVTRRKRLPARRNRMPTTRGLEHLPSA